MGKTKSNTEMLATVVPALTASAQKTGKDDVDEATNALKGMSLKHLTLHKITAQSNILFRTF